MEEKLDVQNKKEDLKSVSIKNNSKNKSDNNKNIDPNINIEQLLKKLREEKNWSYLELLEKLNKKGINLQEKDIKKWEWGLEYPDLNTIYKLSEIYMVPSENFIEAKNNSFTNGINSLHIKIINWICYLTGASFKLIYWLMYTIIGLALIYAFMFFMGKVNIFFSSR